MSKNQDHLYQFLREYAVEIAGGILTLFSLVLTLFAAILAPDSASFIWKTEGGGERVLPLWSFFAMLGGLGAFVCFFPTIKEAYSVWKNGPAPQQPAPPEFPPEEMVAAPKKKVASKTRKRSTKRKG